MNLTPIRRIDYQQAKRYWFYFMPTDALSQISELQAKIQQLRINHVAELKEKLHEARRTVAYLEAELAKVTGQSTPVGTAVRRTRTNPEDIRARVLKALAAMPTGLSQKEIAEATDLNYTTVMIFLKKNLKDFKTTGSLKSKRYFLK
ncbi:MAG: hypothetical protein WCH57_01455 [Verrucomicrobiota bacterium]